LTLWRRLPATPWPATVITLAEALYAGEPCAFALRDALLEAGHAEFAEHFQVAEHPKGCAWLDAILVHRQPLHRA